MNQDLSILHLVLNASLVVQAVMLLLILVFGEFVLIVVKSAGSRRSTRPSSASSGPAPA